MAKKRLTTKKSLREAAKHVNAIREAWARAGYPKEGIDYEGAHYTPLNFGESWPVAPARFRIRISAGPYQGLYVSTIGGVLMGDHRGMRYFLHEQAGAAVQFVDGYSARTVAALLTHLRVNGCRTEQEVVEIKEVATAGK